MKQSGYIKEDVRSSEITPEHVFLNRRDFLGKSVALVSGSLVTLPLSGLAGLQEDDEITPEKIVTSYNNFYEFGTDKSDPVNYAHEMVTDPGQLLLAVKLIRRVSFLSKT